MRLSLLLSLLAIPAALGVEPTVFVVILVRNKAHVLPYFLTLLDRLDYPKDRMSLWIRSDHNTDDSVSILTKWLDAKRSDYRSVDFRHRDSGRWQDEYQPWKWSKERKQVVLALKEAGLMKARSSRADFVLFLDADVLLVRPGVLKALISEKKTVVAPLLKSLDDHANFWVAMADDFTEKPSEETEKIRDQETTGVFQVDVVRNFVLVNLRRRSSEELTFDPEGISEYDGPYDGDIAFAVSAARNQVQLFLANTERFGFVPPPLSEGEYLAEDKERVQSLVLESTEVLWEIPLDEMFADDVEKPRLNHMGIQAVYVINLKRRPERRRRMEAVLKSLGFRATFVDAVDGKTLDESRLKEMGVKLMPEFRDPSQNRPMTYGEIGCVLSHHHAWQEIVNSKRKLAMILEDDAHFEPFFRQRLSDALEDFSRLRLPWDFLYLGRKFLDRYDLEEDVEGSENLRTAEYSYWLVGYLLTYEGAKKLVDAGLLNNLIPSDEFVPVMFDKHPNETYSRHFPRRDLRAYSVTPRLVWPTFYPGDGQYVTDTEDSEQVPDSVFEAGSSKPSKQVYLDLYEDEEDDETASSDDSRDADEGDIPDGDTDAPQNDEAFEERRNALLPYKQSLLKSSYRDLEKELASSLKESAEEALRHLRSSQFHSGFRLKEEL
ncbi:unnamed protein product [Darwinula stevensoni]|uniref:Glycosyl transferase family 25 domain-containing protein n=1 Tax=Darwinula stevensoni TaxID=69355 RepID=A0A7R9A9T3_9CRUS|nr:unnamed protein product [Darwinula stevensoni]CAG0897714.1 unnamed protein product [Darwinula stevensoni]